MNNEADSSDEIDSEKDLLQRLVKDIQSLEKIVESWEDNNQRNTVKALKIAIDELHKEALSRIIKTFRKDKTSLALLKEAAADEIVYAVLRHHCLLKPSLHERVESALTAVRPALQTHGGNVELVRIEPPASVVIRLLGTCNNCPSVDITLTQGVEKAIREYCPEVTDIRKANIDSLLAENNPAVVQFISPFANQDKLEWTSIADLSELPENRVKAFDIASNSLLLYRKEDKVFCYRNSCAHMGLPIDSGEVELGIITCPYHGFRYALLTGECLTAPEVQLQQCPVRVLGTKIEVKIS